jgi:hypothetical protein
MCKGHNNNYFIVCFIIVIIIIFFSFIFVSNGMKTEPNIRTRMRDVVSSDPGSIKNIF